MISVKPLDREKVVEWMKLARVNTEAMPDRLYLYSTGRNLLIDLFLIAETCGEFELVDEEIEDAKYKTRISREEAEGLK